MSDKIKQYMGADEWKGLGRMGRTAGSAAASGSQGLVDQMDAVNRPGVYDNDQYDGMGSPMGDRPFQSYEWFGRRNQTLGNPRGTASMDDHTSGLSQFYHFMDTLEQPGEKRVKLVREAAKAYNRLVKKAREAGHPDEKFTVVANTPDQSRMIWALLKASEEQFPVDTRESQKPVRVASHHEESAERTIARNKDLDTKREGRQALPKTDADIDFAKLKKSFVQHAALKQLRKTVVTTKGGKDINYKGVIAVFADKGREKDAAQAAAGVPAGHIVAPSKGTWKAVNDTKCNARVEKRYEDKSQARKAAEQVIDGSDTTVFYLGDDHKSPTWQHAGYAASQGKLGKAYGADGKMMDITEARRMVLENFVSKQEYARAEALSAFSLPADSPKGRMGLSLIHGEDGFIDDKDIERLAGTGMSITDIADMATTEEGSKELMREHRLNVSTLRALQNEDIMSRAASQMMQDSMDMSSDGDMGIIGPEDMPDSWAHKPPFLYYKGDVSLLKTEKPHAAVIGDQLSPREDETVQHENAIISSRAAPMIAGLGQQDVHRVMVEGTLPVNEEAQHGDIVFVPSGLSIVKDADHAERRNQALENGALLLSTMPPKGIKVWNPKTKEEDLVPSVETDHTVATAARLVGKVSNELVVTNFGKDEKVSASREAIKSFAEREERPVVVDFSDIKHLEQVAGNNALATSRGAKAFQRAGFGDDFALKAGSAFEGARPVIPTGPRIAEAAKKIADKANNREFNPVVSEKPKTKTRNDAEIF